MTKAEPRIVAFCCNWCSYAGADLAGVNRMQYPPNARIIRIMCTGRLEPEYVLKAFEAGADGVLVAGCHIGCCHYIGGNELAKERVARTSELLDVLGIDKRRLRLEWISASEGKKFAETMQEFVKDLKAMGPSPLRRSAE
jgi:F420-non-reducing hydrogenase iron-sulfur subunit